jgi:HEAT repeat protein
VDVTREDPWRHQSAPGIAIDIPELIRQVGSAGEDEVRAAFDQLGYELGGDDGVLRPAVQPAVPLLIEMVEGDLTRWPVPVLQMLARLVPPPGARDLRAEADWGYVGPPARVDPLLPVVRGLLGEHLQSLLRLVISGDAATRAAAARLLAGLPEHAAASIPALVRAADGERDPVPHASMVLAVAALHRDGPAMAGGDGIRLAAWLDARLTDQEAPLVRTAAAIGVASLAMDAQRTRRVLHEAARQLPAGLDDDFVWAECAPDVFLRSAFPDDCPYAVELVGAAVRSADAGRRDEAVCSGKDVMRRWRAATAPIVTVLAELAGDPSARVRQHAVQTLALAGRATTLVSDLLVALLDAPRPTDRVDVWPDVQSSARYGLARLGDPRCVAAVRQALTGPEPTPWLAESLAGMTGHAEALLPDVEWVLTAGRDHARLIAVISGAEAWGDRVAPLADPLLALTRDPAWSAWPGGLPGVLGTLGPRAEPAVPYLRGLLQHELLAVRAAAAVALCRITGDTGAPVRVLRALLNQPDPGPYLAADAAQQLGTAAGALAPGLAPLLDDGVECRTRVAAARARLAATGDTGEVCRTLVASAGPHEHGVRAIEALVRIGPPAVDVLPVLRPMAFSERRVPQCNGDLGVIRDENCQRLARLALARIAPGELA